MCNQLHRICIKAHISSLKSQAAIKWIYCGRFRVGSVRARENQFPHFSSISHTCLNSSHKYSLAESPSTCRVLGAVANWLRNQIITEHDRKCGETQQLNSHVTWRRLSCAVSLGKNRELSKDERADNWMALAESTMNTPKTHSACKLQHLDKHQNAYHNIWTNNMLKYAPFSVCIAIEMDSILVWRWNARIVLIKIVLPWRLKAHVTTNSNTREKLQEFCTQWKRKMFALNWCNKFEGWGYHKIWSIWRQCNNV